MPRARVYVTLKKSVFDPQGKTIHEALRSLGYGSVTDVRQGKFFEVAQGVAEIQKMIVGRHVIADHRRPGRS